VFSAVVYFLFLPLGGAVVGVQRHNVFLVPALPLGGAVVGVQRRSVFHFPAAWRRCDRFSAPFCGSPTRNHIYRAKKACSVFLVPAARRSYGRSAAPFLRKSKAESYISC
jgi:hypothetical protein